MEFQIIHERGDTSEVHAAIRRGIRTADPPDVGARDYVPLYLSLRDGAREIIGGLYGATMWKWLMIEGLWVAEHQRRRGHGSRLLEAAETFAREHGCKGASLGTFDFQAREFYERHGYRLIGELVDFPEGHRHFQLAKRFTIEVGR